MIRSSITAFTFVIFLAFQFLLVPAAASAYASPVLTAIENDSFDHIQEKVVETSEGEEQGEDKKDDDQKDGNEKDGDEKDGEKKDGDEKDGEAKEGDGEDEEKKEKPWKEPKPDQDGVITLSGGLTNPCGIAIQPETNTVFIADSGAMRVVRFNKGKLEPVITDFPKGKNGSGPGFDVGPMGLYFLNKTTLVVGGGGEPGTEMVRAYKVPEPGAEAIKADKMIVDGLKLEKTDDAVEEGSFYGITKTAQGLWVTSKGDAEKGWVSKVVIKGGKPVRFERAIATSELTGVDSPVAITTSIDEGYLVVAQTGQVGDKADSIIGFYEDAKLLGKFTTPLSDISGLAYGVKKKPARLYAIDPNWSDTTKGGLFKIVADKDNLSTNCLAKKMMSLDKPTAMVFDAAGNLYITLLGTSLPGIEGPSGRLIKIKSAETVKTIEEKAAAEKKKAMEEKAKMEAEEKKDADKKDSK